MWNELIWFVLLFLSIGTHLWAMQKINKSVRNDFLESVAAASALCAIISLIMGVASVFI
jgi:hypothetical protein